MFFPRPVLRFIAHFKGFWKTGLHVVFATSSGTQQLAETLMKRTMSGLVLCYGVEV
jgi:hypothetical protein